MSLEKAFRCAIDSRQPLNFSGVNQFSHWTREEWVEKLHSPDGQSRYKVTGEDPWL